MNPENIRFIFVYNEAERLCGKERPNVEFFTAQPLE